MTDFESKVFAGLISGISILTLTQLITMIRDYIRRNRQILKDIYLPLFNAINKCYNTETSFRPNHDIINPLKVNDLYLVINNHIKTNLSKCDIHLIKKYFLYDYATTYDNFKGEGPFLDDLRLISYFMESFSKMYFKSFMHDHDLSSNIRYMMKYYTGLYYFAQIVNDREKAISLSRINWVFLTKITEWFDKIHKKKLNKDAAIKFIITKVNDNDKDMVKSILVEEKEI